MISRIIDVPNIPGEIDIIEVEGTLEEELTVLLNKKCEKNNSNTPDFLLAQYLVGCLDNWNRTTRARDKWYDIRPWGTGDRPSIKD
jgi:hypothetical protein